MSWARAIGAWLLFIIAESVHGIVRQLYLAPWLGELPARQIGILIGSAIVLVISWALIRWIGARIFRQQFAIGFVWVILSVAFEIGLGTALGLTRERMLADYNLARGGFMGFGLLLMLFAPALAARIRGLPRLN